MVQDLDLQLPLVFVGGEEVPILHANEFVIQHHRDGFTLTVGQFAPPILLGDEAERLEQAQQLSYVPVRVIGRFAVTHSRLKELIDVLEQNLAQYEQAKTDVPPDA